MQEHSYGCEKNPFDKELIIGDTLNFAVYLMTKDKCNPKPKPVDFPPNSTAYFTVKKNVKDTDYIFQKVVTTFDKNKATFKIEHNDTINLPVGVYHYDIRYKTENGSDLDVHTIVPSSNLRLNLTVGDI